MASWYSGASVSLNSKYLQEHREWRRVGGAVRPRFWAACHRQAKRLVCLLVNTLTSRVRVCMFSAEIGLHSRVRVAYFGARACFK